LEPIGNFTGFRSDIIVLDRGELSREPLWAKQPIMTLGSSVKFVAEIVSSNWQNDYTRRLKDYAALGILEYWIADYAALGGIQYIGKPKQPTLTLCTLVDREYETPRGRSNCFTNLPKLKSHSPRYSECKRIQQLQQFPRVNSQGEILAIT